MWTIREAHAAEAAAIEAFLVSVPEFRETLRRGEQRHVWEWLYARNGEPVESVLVGENAEGAIVAHYGLSRLPYEIRGRHVDAGMASLLAIDEAFRSTPLFLDVTTRLLKRFRSSGWAFVTGLANRAGLLEFHKAFGFKDIGEVPIFAKPIRLKKIASSVLPGRLNGAFAPALSIAQWLWIAGLRLNSRRSSGAIRLEPMSSFDDATAASSAAIAKYHLRFADRSTPALLNARFFGLSCRTYHVFRIACDDVPAGYVALRIMDMRGYLAVGIVDLCFDFARRDIARAVLRAIDRFAIEQNADLISILANSEPMLARLREHGYLKTPESFRLVIYEPGRVLGLAKSRMDEWFITWFEHDYV